MTAQYWIAQHVADLFRNEPRNVGVFVQAGDQLAAKFFGEIEEGRIDGRRVRNFDYPEVYAQWVDYWRSAVNEGDIEEIVANCGSHYRVMSVGEVTDTGQDSPNDVANYLYALLISEGGFEEATRVGEETEVEAGQRLLEADLTRRLRDQSLLASDNDLLVAHPVRKGATIQGHKTRHQPSFVQENGRLFVMETIDFTTSQKRRPRDHAGYSAYMFRDIRDQHTNTDAIAIVRVTEEDEAADDVSHGLQLLRNEADIVNWLDTQAQNTFIADRKRVALAVG